MCGMGVVFGWDGGMMAVAVVCPLWLMHLAMGFVGVGVGVGDGVSCPHMIVGVDHIKLGLTT